jgi:hypothetical protein
MSHQTLSNVHVGNAFPAPDQGSENSKITVVQNPHLLDD